MRDHRAQDAGDEGFATNLSRTPHAGWPRSQANKNCAPGQRQARTDEFQAASRRMVECLGKGKAHKAMSSGQGVGGDTDEAFEGGKSSSTPGLAVAKTMMANARRHHHRD